MNQKVYLPGLNGIRAIAALAVIIAHINNRLDFFQLEKGITLDMASYGVTIFFTLSGFLITYLLLIEISVNRSIDIRKFYARRILRIWPIYFLYLLIVLLYNGINSFDWTVILYFLILPNFVNSVRTVLDISVISNVAALMIGHYWSLGVEEQFYAFWPWVVKRKKSILVFLILFPICFIILKIGLRIFDAPYYILLIVNYTRFGCLVIGGLGAYLFFKYKDQIKVFNRKFFEYSSFAFFLIVATNHFHITSIIDHEIVSIFTLIIIFNQVNNDLKVVSFENRIFDYLGRISFGMYIYHPIIIFLMSLSFDQFDVNNVLLKKILIYTSVILATIAVAHISYYFFEKKFLKIKSKFITVQSAASKFEFNNRK